MIRLTYLLTYSISPLHAGCHVVTVPNCQYYSLRGKNNIHWPRTKNRNNHDNTTYTEVHVQADNAHRKLWQSTDDCRQAKMFLPGPDKQLLRFALGLKRRQLRILVGLLTGYITLSRHYFDCYKDPNRSTILSMCR